MANFWTPEQSCMNSTRFKLFTFKRMGKLRALHDPREVLLCCLMLTVVMGIKIKISVFHLNINSSGSISLRDQRVDKGDLSIKITFDLDCKRNVKRKKCVK